jgi:hypothetical protein
VNGFASLYHCSRYQSAESRLIAKKRLTIVTRCAVLGDRLSFSLCPHTSSRRPGTPLQPDTASLFIREGRRRLFESLRQLTAQVGDEVAQRGDGPRGVGVRRWAISRETALPGTQKLFSPR